MTVMGKGNTLEFISSQFPDMPVLPFVRFLKTEKTGHFESNLLHAAQEVGFPKPIIIRSDYEGEDGLGHSFAGIFDSIKVKFEDREHLVSACKRVRSGYDLDRVKSYAESRKVPAPHGPIDVILQQLITPGMLGIISEHPSGKSFLIDLIENPDDYSDAQLKYGNLTPREDPLARFSIKYGRTVREQMETVLKDYLRISQAIDARYTGQMEFSLDPYFVLQYRLFRQKEESAIALPHVEQEDRFNRRVYSVPLTFGSTGPEGLELTLHLSGWSDRWEQDPNHAAVFFKSITDTAGFLATREHLPRVLLFLEAARENHPLQSHDTFCLLERKVDIGFVDYDLENRRNADEAKIRYWSDGRQGVIKILKKKEAW